MRRALALTSTVALAAALPAAAQDAGRLDRIERSLKEVRAIVFQGRETGQPVVVRPAGPDPQVQALERRVGDLEQTLQGVNARLDSIAHDLDEAKRAEADARGAAAASADQVKALSDRVGKLETTLSPSPSPQAAAAPPPGPPPPADAEAPGPAGPPARRSRGAEATARAQAGDAGRLGPGASGASAPAAPPAAPPRTELQTYRAARALQASGDNAGAAAAYQDYATRFPGGAHVGDVRYALGEINFVQDNQAEAARAYAQALRGWPKTVWAGDATVKLAQSLVQLNRPDQACAALSEFDTRYATAASSAIRTRAQAVRVRARCAG